MASPVAGWDPVIYDWLLKSGFVKDLEDVRSVVIDIRHDACVTIYTERLASKDMFKVQFPDGITIKRIEP